MSQPKTPMQIGILSAPDSFYARDLARATAALRNPPTLVPMTFDQMHASLGSPDQLEQPQAVVVRSMPLGTLEQVIFRMDCLAGWQDDGLAIVNPPKSLETAIDKWLTLQRLSHRGICVPATVACQTRDMALQAFRDFGSDVVVKPIFGGEGRGIVRIQDEQIAWRVFGALQQAGQVLYVQEFVEHFGYDIRVLKIGDKLHSVRRQASGNWLTNVSMGSRAIPHELSDQQREMAQHAAEIIGGSVLGIDLLPAVDGRLLALEVNAVPGWKATASALDIDISAAVLQHVCQLATEVQN